MAAHFERVLIQHCVVPESLSEIVEFELPDDLLPTEELGNIFRFCHDYWHNDSSRMIAPTPDVLASHPAFVTALAEHEIDLSIDPEGTVSWAVEMAQGAYINRTVQPWVRNFTLNVASPDVDLLEKPVRLDEAIQDLMEIQGRFAKRSEHVDVRSAMARELDSYHLRAATTTEHIRGVVLGMAQIDAHTGGIRDGELCIIGAGPKTGKSFWLLWAAYCHWRAGGVPVLFTLENSVEMTLTRLACMACAIDSRRWDRGQCTPEEIQRVTEWVAYLLAHERPFHILQPEPGKRTVESMVRRARTLGDSIFIDQLTFVEVSKGSERKARHEQIRDMLHELKALISSGKRMPAILAHQINREGVKAAEKTGFVEMYHMAESSEVERTADWVFGLYQGTAMRDGLRAYIQILAARRADLLNWEAIWAPYVGRFEIRTTVTLGQQGTTP